MASTCDIDEALVQEISQFRFAKRESGNAAFVLKIDKNALRIVKDEVHDDISLEDLIEELPENTPRFIILSYKLEHDDGRVNFPLVFIHWTPTTARAEACMLYASAKNYLQGKTDVGRGFDIREPEELTDEYLKKNL